MRKEKGAQNGCDCNHPRFSFQEEDTQEEQRRSTADDVGRGGKKQNAIQEKTKL